MTLNCDTHDVVIDFRCNDKRDGVSSLLKPFVHTDFR